MTTYTARAIHTCRRIPRPWANSYSGTTHHAADAADATPARAFGGFLKYMVSYGQSTVGAIASAATAAYSPITLHDAPYTLRSAPIHSGSLRPLKVRYALPVLSFSTILSRSPRAAGDPSTLTHVFEDGPLEYTWRRP
jgi:hypothetical protein